ncbi:aliphatic sulfonates family ABC transporter, periplasmic ligand-binding protein [Syntrophobotulus glycolicus DSM 8271]|uniref:Aliphatic sulfonates family ABC transporter, periplasmic ligand-binding protein n=1 Tax=Syntrophobotulus glycolicus (strain DSM 8271 / FlGlyR) TaxID=645991 RepID=F0T2N6_SYNGF|nr:NrtA/SsuA/CpmA family ABC transporter substrate-binding protein [Syntrophobotulus glycolicus]ADY56435.1 aliphatic sulfonates family ABC transporter, periplasmic ligand-binding protein [Syntrophobotulus glycolicus DSM 8271]
MGKLKRLMLLLVGLMLLVSPVGCSTNQDKAPEKPTVVNVSYATRPINVPSIAALEKKTFEEEFAQEGITIKWVELEGPATTEALAAKSIDIATSLNYVTGLVTKSNGNDIKFISKFSSFPKAIGLVAGTESGISELADLKGKKIALQKNTMLHEMLLKALAKANLKAEDVEIESLASPEAANAVMQKQVDAAIIPDPLLTSALASKKVTLITTAEGLIPGETFIAARTEFVQKYPEVVKKFLELHQQTLTWVSANQEEALNLAAKFNKLDIKIVQALYPKYDFGIKMDESTITNLKQSAELLKQNQMIKDEVDTTALVNNLVDSRYLPQ